MNGFSTITGVRVELPNKLRSPNSFPTRRSNTLPPNRKFFILLEDRNIVTCHDPKEVYYLTPKMAGWNYYE